MQRRWRGGCLSLVFLVICPFLNAWSAEVAEAEAKEPSWYPEFALGFDIFFMNATTSVSSDSIPTLWEPQTDPPGSPGYPSGYPDSLSRQNAYPFTEGETRSYSLSDGSENYSSAMVALEFALVGPLLSEGSLRPRPFLDLRGQVPMGPRHTLSSLDSAYDTILAEIELFRDNLPYNPPRFADRPVFASASSESTSVTQDGAWSVGLGMSLRLPFFTDRVVTLRPSVSYFGEQVVYRGSFASQEFADPNNPYDQTTQESTGIPVMAASTEVPVTLHGVAPRVGIDALIGRRGPLEISVYAQYEARIILSNNDFSRVVDNQIGDGSVRFDFSEDTFRQSLGFGLRMRFVGKNLIGS